MRVNPVNTISSDLYWTYKKKKETERKKQKQRTYIEVEHKIDIKS